MQAAEKQQDIAVLQYKKISHCNFNEIKNESKWRKKREPRM